MPARRKWWPSANRDRDIDHSMTDSAVETHASTQCGDRSAARAASDSAGASTQRRPAPLAGFLIGVTPGRPSGHYARVTEVDGVLLRRVRLRPELLPVPIYTVTRQGDEVLPIQPTWLGVVRWWDGNKEAFELAFFTDDGTWLEGLEYDTMQIALDQAAWTVGVHEDEWETTAVEMPPGRNGPSWGSQSA